jgi:hypothetical protein
MNIEISTKEYRDLMDILHIADVVLSGHRRAADERSVRHRSLIQKLYAFAKGQENLDRLISYNESAQAYVPTLEFEQNSLAHRLIDEFGDHLFWDELIARLSFRDAAQIVGGIDRLNAMNESERQAVEGPIRQHYIEEFSKNGVVNLAVIERFDSSGETVVRTSD